MKAVRSALLLACIAFSQLGVVVPQRGTPILLPTHQWDFQVDTTPQRGGTTPTFTRASSSSRLNTGTDYFTALASDAAAITGVPTVVSVADPSSAYALASNSESMGVRIGGPESYEVLRSTALGNAVWTAVGTSVVTANDATFEDVYNVTTQDTVTDDDAGVAEHVAQVVTLSGAASVPWTFSAWVNCQSDHTVTMQLEFTGGANLVSGDFSCVTASRLFSVTAVNSTTQLTATVRLFGASSTVSTTGVAVWGHAELRQSPASLRLDMPDVAGTVVARAAEELSYSSVSPGTNGTWCAWLWYDIGNANGVYETPLFSWDGTTNFEAYLGNTGTFRAAFDTAADDADVLSTTTFTGNAWGHLCVAWIDGTQLNLFINGAEVTYSGTNDETWTAGGDYGTALLVGKTLTRGPSEELVLSRMKMWNRTLLPAQITSLYNRERGKYGL